MSHRGRFNAFVGTVMTLGVSTSPMFIGFYIEAYSLALVWPLMFAIGMAGAGLMFTLYTIEKKAHALRP
jgi:MFS family permease